MFNPFPFAGRATPPTRPTLTQACSCGASIEIDIAKTWDPTGTALRWFATHPCPNRTQPITREGR